MNTNPEQIVKKLAQIEFGLQNFVEALPPELANSKHTLPDGLAEDVLAYLKEKRPYIFNKLEIDSSPIRTYSDPLSIGVFVAILFLLRLDIEIKYDEKGLTFKIATRTKSNDSDLLEKICDMLNMFGGG